MRAEMADFESVGRSRPEGLIRVDPRAVKIFDAEWAALQGEEEPASAPIVSENSDHSDSGKYTECPAEIEPVVDSPLVIAAKNYAQASAFLEAAHEKLLNAQRVFETATEAKQKAVEELKRVVQEAA
jgi:hypothetical protein